jgi:hypothetical protein
MEDTPQDRRVRLISQGFNAWKVQVLFTDRNMGAAEISERLHEVKDELARQFGVPDTQLEYARLLSRKNTRNGLLVEMQIVKQQLPSGAPRFRPAPARAEDGSMFSDMRIEADLFPFDEFEQPLSRLAVEARLAAEGMDIGCVNWQIVLDAIDQMRQTMKPVMALEIGLGTIPSLGSSSRLTYGIPPEQEAFLPTAWMGTRPVSHGDFLLEASPSTGGFRWGRNVYGRELEPRQGMQTRLEAGEGTRLTLRGTRLVSMAEGMLQFDRIGRDKRDRDTYDMVPAKVVGQVLPAIVFQDSQVYRLELDQPAAIYGTVKSGSRIVTNSSLFVDGDVEDDAEIECHGTLRVSGAIRKARLTSRRHICVNGFVSDSALSASLVLHLDQGAVNSSLCALDAVARETRSCSVEAIRQIPISHLTGGGAATAIRINLRKFLENQQASGRTALDELRTSLSQIVDIFGPEITLQVTESTASRLMLKWLRKQKTAGVGNYTHAEVQELKTILEMIPLIREQLTTIGMELRDVTAQMASVAGVNAAP